MDDETTHALMQRVEFWTSKSGSNWREGLRTDAAFLALGFKDGGKYRNFSAKDLNVASKKPRTKAGYLSGYLYGYHYRSCSDPANCFWCTRK